MVNARGLSRSLKAFLVLLAFLNLAVRIPTALVAISNNAIHQHQHCYLRILGLFWYNKNNCTVSTLLRILHTNYDIGISRPEGCGIGPRVAVQSNLPNKHGGSSKPGLGGAHRLWFWFIFRHSNEGVDGSVRYSSIPEASMRALTSRTSALASSTSTPSWHSSVASLLAVA